MKRYVKSARYLYKSASDLRDQLNAYRQDLRSLARCENIEDVQNQEWLTWKFDKFITKQVEDGEDFYDVLDSFIDSVREEIKQIKNDITDSAEYEAAAEEEFEMLKKVCSVNYDVIDTSRNAIIIQPPEGATHQDCIKFVDEIVELINGRYIETGRGGSWTTWNLISDTGVRLRAGWYGRRNEWMVKVERP